MRGLLHLDCPAHELAFFDTLSRLCKQNTDNSAVNGADMKAPLTCPQVLQNRAHDLVKISAEQYC